MANALYTLGKQALIGQVSLDVDTIKVGMLSSAYTPNLGAHQFYSDVSANAVGTPQTCAGKSITNGVFNFTTATFAAVAGGSTVRYFVIYKDTGVPGTSPLIALIDTTTGATLPITTNGGDITFTPDSGANKLFALT